MDQARAADPAFIGSDDTARSIWDTASRCLIIDGMDFSHPAMGEARRAWHEALGTTPGEAEAIELLATLQCKPIRDRILVDAISAAEDPATYRQVMIRQFEGQRNWSRVDATEDLLTHLLTGNGRPLRGWLFGPGRAVAELRPPPALICLLRFSACRFDDGPTAD